MSLCFLWMLNINSLIRNLVIHTIWTEQTFSQIQFSLTFVLLGWPYQYQPYVDTHWESLCRGHNHPTCTRGVHAYHRLRVRAAWPQVKYIHAVYTFKMPNDNSKIILCHLSFSFGPYMFTELYENYKLCWVKSSHSLLTQRPSSCSNCKAVFLLHSSLFPQWLYTTVLKVLFRIANSRGNQTNCGVQ